MALADRRPLGNGFSVETSSTPASPSFNPQSLNLSSAASSIASPNSGGMISSSTNSTTSPQPAELSGSMTTTTTSTTVEPNEDFTYKSKVNDFKGKYSNENDIKPLTPEKSLSPIELSPTSRSISPDSLMNTESFTRSSTNSVGGVSSNIYGNNSTPNNGAGFVPKKPKNSSRAPIATGISTTIPVTGEKPKPEQKNDASLQDDVLYAIFLILYEKDPEGLGMTVKQICDTLVERHPEMANLSTKTSNLVSAKLNAYVKRVEKGDANLKYALSRDWADASPKRMVYVYRGLLTDDFHLHVKNAMEIQKQQQQQQQQQHSLNNDLKKLTMTSSASGINNGSDKNIGQGNLSGLNGNVSNGHASDSLSSSMNTNAISSQQNIKPRRQTMYDLGVTKNTFMDTPIDKSNLFVPYSSAPVTASLSGNDRATDDLENDSDFTSPDLIRSNLNEHLGAHNGQDSDMDFEDFEVFDENDEGDDLVDIETFKTFNKAKRSKSLSYLTMGKKTKILTAAAAAPRASKSSCSNTPNAAAAAAAAALHAAAIKAMLPYSTNSSNSPTGSSNSSTTDIASMKNGNLSGLHNKKWLNVVRSGFMTQDIGTPEDISLSDLDKFFS